MRKRYNTPHRSRVVKTRLSEKEYADFTERLAPYGISQSEFLRQAIRRATIRPVIHVSAVNDELLAAVGRLAAEYGRIGAKFGREEQAQKLVDEFNSFMDEYRSKNAGKDSPKVLVLMGLPGSYIIATENSYVGSLVKLAGGTNVYGDGDGQEFLNVNTEDMQSKNPDVILRAAHALPDQVKEMFAEEFETNDIWKHFDAVKNGRVYDLDSSLFNMSANFSYPEALEALSPMLYGK